LSTEPNWPLINREVVRLLQDLIRLNTTNLPGNELIAAEHIAAVLKKEGHEPLVLESAPGRGNVIARLKGTGEKPPLLLYGHTDVVPAEPQHWTQPPFSGALADGYVWGRGALDMKGTVAQQLLVFLLLKRHNVPLKRDVIFAATADEEVGGEDSAGVAWLIKHHPDLLQAEFGLTEVGGYSTELGGKTLFPIQVAEKGIVWLKMRAKGRPGHGSIPHADNAVVHLARAVDRLATRGLPFHLVDAANGFLESAATGIGGSLGEALSRLRSPLEAEAILKSALNGHELQPFFTAMLHNTAAPTGLRAGYKVNVIPGEAEVTIDGRTLPGFDTEAFLAELQNVVGEGFEFEVLLAAPPLETSHDTPLFKLIAETLRAHEPGAVVVPYMMSGATDAKYVSRLGVKSYGFAPLKLPKGFPYMELFHAHNERVPIHGLGWGVRVLYDVVKEFCGA
jgi:acetylornithine deacetylase/succinyl-diaminopimelate desuccinylase-like protein